MPPSMLEMPSPAMSALKKYLVTKGNNCKIIYWNLKLFRLQQDFVWGQVKSNEQSETLSLLLFDNYIAHKLDNHKAKSKIKCALMGIKPSIVTVDPNFYDRHMELYAQKLDKYTDEVLSDISWKDVLFVGFSASLYQWISSSILADKIKILSPTTPIIIGGIGTKDAAIDILTNFSQFEFAIWGEGEYSIAKFAEVFNKGISYEFIKQIPHLAYKSTTGIIASEQKLKYFVDLNDTNYYPEFDDFFEQIKEEKLSSLTYLPIEGSRGCHWNKCHFCYLNSGYIHRVKSWRSISEQLQSLIEKYHIYSICFLDNDIISNDWNRFDNILNVLIDLKNNYPDLEIVLAEIITKGITEYFIRKMSLAGFKNVQIGYESPSNNLLNKIDKKNSFASNLLFIKFAYKYNININGMNVITGLLEETAENIEESIVNLRYMRFFLRKFSHNMSRLGIMHSSKYFKNVKGDNSFVISGAYYYLPDDYILDSSVKECYFVEKVIGINNHAWNFFSLVEKYYKENNYCYRLFNIEDSIIYKEYLNNEEINELEVNKNSIEFIILNKANSSVLSLSELRKYITHKILDCELYDIIENMKAEGLIYASNDYSEILSIIDIKNNI